MLTTIRVQVAGKVREYAAGIAEFGDFLAAGGQVVSLHEARRQAREFFRGTASDAWRALTFWVELDSSGLAYHVEINRGGSWAIQTASPMPGPDNVRELYVA
jgi:hypothetical protein